jgi:hypothetical protein
MVKMYHHQSVSIYQTTRYITPEDSCLDLDGSGSLQVTAVLGLMLWIFTCTNCIRCLINLLIRILKACFKFRSVVLLLSSLMLEPSNSRQWINITGMHAWLCNLLTNTWVPASKRQTDQFIAGLPEPVSLAQCLLFTCVPLFPHRVMIRQALGCAGHSICWASIPMCRCADIYEE